MTLRVFLVAGEPSGDALGGPLIAALRRETGGDLVVDGVGGPAMIREGLTSLFPMSDLSVVGLAEVLPRLPRLILRIGETVRAVRAFRPDAVITIDSPDFGLRVQGRLRRLGAARIQYVAPSVWAWRPGRAGTLASQVDAVLALLPFEQDFFRDAGLDCRFVGHPAVSPAALAAAALGDGPALRRRFGIAGDAPVVAALLGSRRGEVARHVAPFAEAVRLLARRHRGLRVLLPTVSSVLGQVQAASRRFGVPTHVVDTTGPGGAKSRVDAFTASDVALAASGTVTLELARSDVPMVVAYRLNPLTGLLARKLVRVPYVSLVNLVLDRAAVPEKLLGDCRGPVLAEALGALLSDPVARDDQRRAFREALQMLSGGATTDPSDNAARAVIDIVRRHSL